jgi:thiol-disulfide isomerase/thioredoxin
MLITRRTALAAAGGTLAAAPFARKLAAQEIRGFEAAFKPTDPPAPPPALSFTDPDGKTRTLADYAGKPVVLNLWATWCMPCVAEMPALDRLADQLKDIDAAVLPISSDRGGISVVRAFYASHGIRDLPVLLDPDGAATRACKVRGIPTTLIIDGSGKERGRTEGAVAWTDGASLTALRKQLMA